MVPMVMAAGRAGGTVIVIRSKDLSIVSSMGIPYYNMVGKVPRNPKTAKIAIAPTKSIESL